jgi:universal stress protein E
MEKILAVINDWKDAEAVISRSEHLAEKLNTDVELLRPVHSPAAELSKYTGLMDLSELRNAIMAEERDRMEAVCRNKPWHTNVEWSERVHKTIVEQAESLGAGMIITMASHHSLLSTLAHTPDDWHLFRDSPCPVLTLTRNRVGLTKVVAAIDALDHSEAHLQLSARIIDQAAGMAMAEGVPLSVLGVVPDPALLYAGLVNAPMGGNFQAQAIALAEKSLEELLKHLGVKADEVVVKAGQVEDIVSKEGQQGALLVIGSAANKGVRGFFIGNTAERILHRMQSDMYVVN